MMMEESNKRKIRESIEGLKPSKAPDIWSQIRSDLDDEQEQNTGILTHAIRALKKQQAPDVWLPVASALERKPVSPWKYLSIAAAVTLIAVSIYLFLPKEVSRESITYSTEEVEVFEVGVGMSPLINNADDRVLTYIKENCAQLAITCQDPGFKALLEAYMELNKTKEKLNMALQQTTNQPQLMKYLIKVEKDQAEIGKDMLKKLRSI